MAVMCAHILLAEDDRKQAELVRRYLEREQHSVSTALDGRSALDDLRTVPCDLLVLDRMLPDIDGPELCRILRNAGDLPVLMLTARATEDDMLRGLDAGADDYITKPFSPRELAARVRALLRRSSARAVAPTRHAVIHVGDLVIDALLHQVSVAGRVVECTPGEFRLLEALASQPERVFTREQLVARLHDPDSPVTRRSIDVHVMNLRRKIGQPGHPTRLSTVYGVGYKLTTRR